MFTSSNTAVRFLLMTIVSLTGVAAQDLTLTCPAYAGAIVGQPFTYAITTAPASATGYAAAGLPSGLVVNPATGVITGTPTTAGSSLVMITAQDAAGPASKTVRLDINVSGPLALVHPGHQIANIGIPFYLPLQAIGNPTSYQAVGLPPGLTINGSGGLVYGIPTASGSYPVSLIVTDSQSSWVTSLSIDIYPNAPALSARTVISTVGSRARFIISATNAATSYRATSLPDGLAIDTVTGIISGTPTTAGTSSVTITASNAGGTGSASWTMIVNPAGVGSVDVANPLPDAGIGSAYSAQIAATGSPTSYAATGLPNSLTADAATGIISGTPAAGDGGAYPLVLSAIYPSGTVSAIATLQIDPVPPVITAPPTVLVNLHTAFSCGIQASNQPTSYSASGLPPGLAIDTSLGLISGSATTAGTYPATISATNAGGTGTTAVTFVALDLPITASASGPSTPIIAGSEAITAFVGIPMSSSVLATNAPASYAATDLPPGLSIDAATGVISGTPTMAGVFRPGISCTNSAGTSTTTVNVFVRAMPAPVFESGLNRQYAAVGSAFTDQIVVAYGPAAFAATGLPPGCSIDAASGLISGTPSIGGTYGIIVSATNASGTTQANLTIVVSPSLPTYTYPARMVAKVGRPCSFAAGNGSGTTFSASGLPPGLGIDAATGVISGTPTAPGIFPITVNGTGTGGTSSQDLTIYINPAGAAIITSSLATQTVAVGTPVNYTLTATAGATLAATDLPPGLSFDPTTGILSGAPTSGGTYTIVLSATSGGVTENEPLIIKVTPAPPAITNENLAKGRLGVFYFDTINATNTPTSFSASGLPSGLSLDPVNGIISGVPTVAGDFAVTMTATNDGGSGSASVTLVVNPPLAPVITSATTIYTLPNVQFSYQITALNGPISFSAVGLPSGVTIDTAQGIISGMTSDLGAVPVVISATNASGSDSEMLTIDTVAHPSPGTPPPTGTSSSGGHGCGLGFGAALVSLLGICGWMMLWNRPSNDARAATLRGHRT